MTQIGTSFLAGGGTKTFTFAPFHSDIERVSGDEVSWSIPDAMTLKQIILTPFPLQSSNDQNVDITWKLLVEDNVGVLRTRASLSYESSAPDTSPPPSNPMDPVNSLGEVWDLGLVILANARIQIKMTTSSGSNNGGDNFQCGLVGTWLRDIPA